MKTTTRDMTSGTIWKHIVFFSIPLLIGNLFQQLYNTVDSVVVGNFVSRQALAAVGSTGPVINTLVGFFMGFSTGAGVVISHCFGGKDEKKLHLAIHTTMLMTLILGVLFTIAGVLMVPFMVWFMKTPEDVVQEATLYLRIYFAGVGGLMIYNMGSGILRAVGDSRRPLYFLCITSALNVVLDLVFVIVFHMGIEGVALATVTSEFISALLVLYVLITTKDIYRLVLKDLALDKKTMQKIFGIGLPAGLQMAVTAFSNVFVQSYINRFGSACMAGWTAYSKIDQFVLLPMQSLSLAATTFVGQNLGARNTNRAETGTRVTLFLSLGITIVFTVFINVFATPLTLMFTQDEQVIKYGCLFLNFLSPFYVCCCFNQVYAGSLRGSGDANAPMVIMLGAFVVFRQIYLASVIRFTEGIYPVAFGYPAGWIVCSISMFVYYYYIRKKRMPLQK